ncbi:hypothetical protein ACQP25_09445 [Microtetraspora malaysiensis]|uniref:hypothetical protein n=1 Tax=Microtetraspora malaysiensis TaxID=161358 RepID=UPI003D93D604
MDHARKLLVLVDPDDIHALNQIPEAILTSLMEAHQLPDVWLMVATSLICWSGISHAAGRGAASDRFQSFRSGLKFCRRPRTRRN